MKIPEIDIIKTETIGGKSRKSFTLRDERTNGPNGAINSRNTAVLRFSLILPQHFHRGKKQYAPK